MSYHLKPDEHVSTGLKRIVSEELASGAAHLENKDETDWHHAIHEARKSVKKVRAVLRLVKPQLGKLYRVENSGMREIGQKLSEIRDAGATVETFDALRENSHDELNKHGLRSIRRVLVSQKEEAEQGARAEGVLTQVAETLRGKIDALQRWPLNSDGFVAIGDGLENTYRRGRKAFDTARRHPRPESFHEWRKRVKDHWYHVRLLFHGSPDSMRDYEQHLKELETWLGDDHNLVVLRDKISNDPEVYGSQEDVDAFLELIGKHQRELRHHAVTVGEKIYDDKPGKFSKRMRHLYNTHHCELADAPSPVV